jgi:hypothetical protein
MGFKPIAIFMINEAAVQFTHPDGTTCVDPLSTFGAKRVKANRYFDF